LLEKLTEYLGKKYIGRCGHTSTSSSAIVAWSILTSVKWATVGTMLRKLNLKTNQANKNLSIAAASKN
jgi:hypothetical protein